MILFGTGLTSKIHEDTFELSDSQSCPILAREVPLTNYYRDEIIDGKNCQSTFTAMSPSFRSGCLSWRDTGLIR